MRNKSHTVINQHLNSFLQKKIQEAQIYQHRVYLEVVEQIISLVKRGTDRIRPRLVLAGYQLFYKKEKPLNDQIISIACAVEMFHTACLIHDDIMDDTKTRRGKTTIYHFFPKPQNTGLAILAGDLALIWADELFFQAVKDCDNKKELYDCYLSLKEEVIFGQTMDLQGGSNKSKKEILRTYTYKTAKYSFERPLMLGAILSGADRKQLRVISGYAINAGLAFQIKDDLLGVFGQEKIVGKDRGSDIREGKYTLLISNFESTLSADRFGILNSIEKERFTRIFGNCNVETKEIEWLRKKIRETGADKKCLKTAVEFAEEGKKGILGYNGKTNGEVRQFLLDLADWCVERDE